MARKVSIFTAQFGDIPLEQFCAMAQKWGYDGIEIACNDNHLNLEKLSEEYCAEVLATLQRYGLELCAVSNHAVE